MTRLIERDATNVILTVIVLDSDGAAIPNIEWNDPDRAIHWRASASGSWTEITRSEGTIGTWSSGGWVHLGGGVYQLGLPNAAVVAGDRTTVRLVYDTHPPQYAAIDAVLYPPVDVSGDVSAIKAKTDNLPASPAAVGSAMTLTPGERTSISDSVWTRATRTITTAIPTANQTRDAVWAASSRTLTANPGLDADGMRSALGMSSDDLDTQIVGILDAIDQIPGGGGGGLSKADVRDAIGLTAPDLGDQLADILEAIDQIPGGGGGGLSKADVRDAIGLTAPDLGDQLADILEAISDIEVGGELMPTEDLAAAVAELLRTASTNLWADRSLLQRHELHVYQRDDYLAADGRAFEILIELPEVDFTGATAVAGAGAKAGDPVVQPTTTIIDTGTIGRCTLRLEFTSAMLDIAPGNYMWDAHILLSTRRNTVVSGRCVVHPKYADEP